ncbi:MAG: EthD family reductase [Thermoleophilia bacterium]
MIRVLVMYPRTEGKRFDLDYYRDHHMPLVKERLAPIKVEIDLGFSGGGDLPAPYHAVSHMTFASREELASRYAAAAEELNKDKEKFTDVEIIRQISEVLEV